MNKIQEKVLRQIKECEENDCTVLGTLHNVLNSILGPEFQVVTIDPQNGLILIEDRMSETEYTFNMHRRDTEE